LRLYTPVKYEGLPGMPFPGSPWTYPLKDEVADYLEAYATRFEFPVRTGVRVERVEAFEGGYAEVADGQRIEADNIVVATGTFGRTPFVPDFAADLDPGILQLHSSEYRRPYGWPREDRGVVDDAPGLFFCGLSFQNAFSSMVLPGVGRDAAYLAGRIAVRAGTRLPAQSEPYVA
jgi:hypothetical protein